MSKSNGNTEDTNVIGVGAPTELPYSFIPYHSVAAARAAANRKDSGLDPNKTLYVFEAKYAGVKIVAYPILMVKPEPEEEVANDRGE